jgi:hypothetical protein
MNQIYIEITSVYFRLWSVTSFCKIKLSNESYVRNSESQVLLKIFNMFSSCCDKDSAFISTTGRQPDVNPP